MSTNPSSSSSSSSSTLPNGMTHIDRNKLYTDLKYRVNYVADFIGFTKDDQNSITASIPLLQPLIPTLIDAVYVHLFRYDITAKSFLHRMSGYNGKVIQHLHQINLSSDQIKFRKSMLKKYLETLVTGINDIPSILEYLNWVAVIHTSNKDKSTPSLHIDYIHCNALMSFVNTAFINVINGFNIPADQKLKMQLAYTKLFWLQMDIFSLYYVSDGLDIPNHLAHQHKVQHTVTSADQLADGKVSSSCCSLSSSSSCCSSSFRICKIIHKSLSIIGVGSLTYFAYTGIKLLINRK